MLLASLLSFCPSFSNFPQLPHGDCALSSADSHVGGLLYILGSCWSLQRTLLWGWEFFPPPQLPQIFTARGFWGLISLCWNPGLHGLSCSSVVPPSLSTHECGIPGLPPAATWPHILSAPPTSLDKCFFFNSLVVRLPCSLILRQYWLFLFLNWLLSFFLLCKGAERIPTPPSWLELWNFFTDLNFGLDK